MEVGGDAVLLHRAGLIGAAAGDEGEGGLVFQRDLDLGLDERGGGEAEEAHAPGAACEALSHVGEERVGLRGAHQRRATMGRAPPVATASAKAAVSLTRVMGPWTMGQRVPWGSATPVPRQRGVAWRRGRRPARCRRSARGQGGRASRGGGRGRGQRPRPDPEARSGRGRCPSRRLRGRSSPDLRDRRRARCGAARQHALPGCSMPRQAMPLAPSIRTVSAPVMRDSTVPMPGGSVDSRKARVWSSSTTPAAPPIRRAAVLCWPTPPRTKTVDAPRRWPVAAG